MRAREVSMYVICVAMAAPLVTMTGVFSAGPSGVTAEYVKNAFMVSGVVGVLASGGASIMGFSFKVPAVLTAFVGVYAFSAALLTTLVGQLIAGFTGAWDVAATFSGVFTAIFAVLGYYAALEIAGGPHGPMG